MTPKTGLLLTAALLLGSGAVARAADLAPSTVSGSPPGFNFPLSFDSTTADPKNHRIIYQDDHVRTLEVTLWPYDKEVKHGHAYPSFFVSDEPQPAMRHDTADAGKGLPPFGFIHPSAATPAYLHCMTLGPQDPHAETIVDSYPQHFWRMEFKQFGTPLTAANWQARYPDLVRPTAVPTAPPVSGAAFSPAWPYPIGDETVRAAPANFIQRYDDGHVRIIEVIVRPGETTPVFGSPYYAVEGFDGALPGTPGGATLEVRETDPASPLLAQRELGLSDKPKGLDGPQCRLVGPTPPRQISNRGTVPAHYYRFELLRVDGERFKQDWKTMYPDMAEGPPVMPTRGS